MKKSFTLIELLSVIAILAVILLIAVPKILSVIETSKAEAYKINNKMLLKAAELYVADNLKELSFSENDTIEITLDELKTEKYIKEINMGNTNCNGYVLVTKISNDEYSYNPHLNCTNSSIGNTVDDGLLVHYTFNDFQEPTENLIYFQNPRIDENYTPYIITTSGTWQVKHPDAIKVYNINNEEITGYVNTGVTDWINTYHATWIYDNELKKPVVIMRDLDGAWKAKSFQKNMTFNEMNLAVGEKYTVSWLQWTDNIDKRADVGFYGSNLSGLNNFHDGLGGSQLSSKNKNLLEWERVFATFTVNSSWNLDYNLRLYMYGANYMPGVGTLKIADIQLETKGYMTPYTEQNREGVIKDYSLNNRDATLELETTPKWTQEEKDKFYKFFGTNYIESTWTYNEIPFTISYWAKTTYSQTTPGLVSFTDTNGFRRDLYILDNNKLRLFVYNGTNTMYGDSVVIKNFNDGKWHHFAATYDGTSAYVYADGVKYSVSLPSYGGTYPVSKLRIGALNISTMLSQYYYQGDIDNVSIYSRVLTESEIKNQYYLYR